MSQQLLRIAVTGGSGGVGQPVVRYLAGQGHSVVNIDQRTAADLPARHIYMDVRRRELLQPVLEQVDAVLHLGEIPHAGRFSDHETYAHNAAAAATVLSTAADLKLRHVVYTSTCQVYGMWGEPTVPPLRLPVDEDHPVQPTNAYSVSKVANEGYCRFISSQYGLRVSIFRLPWVMLRSWEEQMMRWMQRSADRRRQRDGLGTYVHGEDLGSAYEAALLTNREGCHTYNLAASDVMMRQGLRAQLRAFHADWPSPPEDWPDDRSVLKAERARQELGWEPRWSVREQYERITGEAWKRVGEAMERPG